MSNRCSMFCMTSEERILHRYYKYLENDDLVSPRLYIYTITYAQRDGPPDWFKATNKDGSCWYCFDKTIGKCFQQIKRRVSRFLSDSTESSSASFTAETSVSLGSVKSLMFFHSFSNYSTESESTKTDCESTSTFELIEDEK